MHVLLVEDSPINRRFIGLALSKAGIDVTCADNGREGVEQAAEGRFDAILLDMQMPVMNGFEAASRLRELGLATPIVALTGCSTAADRQRCLEAGCDDHLPKPVESAKLVAMLDCLVDGGGRVDARADSQDFCPELREIALDYLETQRQRLEEMKELLEIGDYQCLAEMAHRVKGTAGTVGFPAFTDPAKALEDAADGCEKDSCRNWLAEIGRLQLEAEASVAES